MDVDAKVTPLKALQGLIWRDGYRSGALQSILYPDVAPQLRAWSDARIRLHVYSSGSSEAQQQLFAYSADGDLSGVFANFFDTRIGAKRESSSYARILTAIEALAPEDVLFLSDVEAELDAAEEAGLLTLQLVRPEDGTVPSTHHPTVASFADIRL
jgi:enolase-phosphatase E1